MRLHPQWFQNLHGSTLAAIRIRPRCIAVKRFACRTGQLSAMCISLWIPGPPGPGGNTEAWRAQRTCVNGFMPRGNSVKSEGVLASETKQSLFAITGETDNLDHFVSLARTHPAGSGRRGGRKSTRMTNARYARALQAVSTWHTPPGDPQTLRGHHRRPLGGLSNRAGLERGMFIILTKKVGN